MSEPIFSDDFRAMLDQLLIWRRDVRHFSTQPLPVGEMDALLERACLAPSVGNSQPWRFVHVATPELRANIIAHVDAAKHKAAEPYNDDTEQKARYDSLKLHGLAEAPEHLAVFCDEEVAAGHGLGRQTMAETLDWSTVMAIHNLWLVARTRGIGVGWVSILDPDTITHMLDVPPAWRLIAYLCIGYPANPSDTPELVERGWQDRHSLDALRFTR